MPAHDLLLQHKDELFSHLVGRWRHLFNTNFDVLLYELTSIYFEVNASDLPEGSRHCGPGTLLAIERRPGRLDRFFAAGRRVRPRNAKR